jgi:hypothetical protein
LFEKHGGKTKEFTYNGFKSRVFTFLYTQDENILSKGYRKYWVDNMEKALDCIRSA